MAQPQQVRINELKIDNLNGSYVRHRSGIFVPSRQVLDETLLSAKVSGNESVPYVPQGNEIFSLEIARRNSQSVLIAGPTGVGKSMLVRHIAKKWDVPYLYITCDPDKTEGKLMGRADLLHTTVELDGTVHGMSFQVFRPSAISISGLAEQPVVLFIDELHKLRKDVDSLFHPLVHERVVNLTDHLGPGATFKLHPETLVVFALNPYYGDGGIEKVGPAMRQRLKTLYFPMVTSEEKLLEIVKANVSGLDGVLPEVTKMCEMCASICRIYLEYRRESISTPKDKTLTSDLKAILPMLNEAPSPRVIVNAAKSMVAGQRPLEAIKEDIFNSIANDFGQIVQSLVTMAESRFNFK